MLVGNGCFVNFPIGQVVQMLSVVLVLVESNPNTLSLAIGACPSLRCHIVMALVLLTVRFPGFTLTVFKLLLTFSFSLLFCTK